MGLVAVGFAMPWTLSLPSLEPPTIGSAELWVIGILSFGVGDLVTTGIGLGVVGLTEHNPIAAALVDRYGLAALVVPKVAVVVGCYLAWRAMGRPHREGIPLGLAALGVAVTGWNLLMLLSAAPY